MVGDANVAYNATFAPFGEACPGVGSAFGCGPVLAEAEETTGQALGMVKEHEIEIVDLELSPAKRNQRKEVRGDCTHMQAESA